MSGWGFVAVVLIATGVLVVAGRLRRNNFIDDGLNDWLGGLQHFRAYGKVLPRFRYVDLYQAAASLVQESNGWLEIETSHPEGLAMILNRRFHQPANRQYRRVEMIARVTGPGDEKFFPVDSFWILPVAAARKHSRSPSVIRVRQGPQPFQSTLEIAARSRQEGTELIERIVQRAAEGSIYRNHLLELESAGEVHDEQGNNKHNANFDLVFNRSYAP